MTLDFTRCRLPPFAHQREDVAWLLERPYALIASEMRTGKSKIVVDAAQFLFEFDLVDKVIVVAPAPVRDVWYDPELGEIAKHGWLGIRHRVVEYHAKLREWILDPLGTKTLTWYVSNFEFLRSKARFARLLTACGPKTMLVLDEGSFVKNHRAQQTKACLELRRACGRVVILNGTPIFHSPLDLFSQGNILHENIIGSKFITHFKARYAIQAPVLERGKPMVRYGKVVQDVKGWTNLDDLQRRFAPHTVRRLQKDCLDLPPKLDPVTLTATLTPETWRAYKDMKDELVVWLRENAVATSATAAVKMLRLSQITNGFVGGVEDAGIDGGDNYSGLDDLCSSGAFETTEETSGKNTGVVGSAVEVGREKLDVLLWFIEQRLEADANLHLVAWGRFRPEVFRMEAEVKKRFPQFETGLIVGGQKKADRLKALSLLKPETSPAGPVFVAGIEGTGSFGLDMTAAHTCVIMSGGYSPGRSAQTLDRVYGPGQTHPIAYFDVVAVGPSGQKTVDRDILIARRAGQDVASWTADAWVKALTEE